MFSARRRRVLKENETVRREGGGFLQEYERQDGGCRRGG